jgi:hypothetical protein
MKYLFLFLIPLNAIAVSNQPIRFGSTFSVTQGFYRGCSGFVEGQSLVPNTYYVSLECRVNDRVKMTIHEKLSTSDFTLD